MNSQNEETDKTTADHERSTTATHTTSFMSTER